MIWQEIMLSESDGLNYYLKKKMEEAGSKLKSGC